MTETATAPAAPPPVAPQALDPRHDNGMKEGIQRWQDLRAARAAEANQAAQPAPAVDPRPPAAVPPEPEPATPSPSGDADDNAGGDQAEGEGEAQAAATGDDEYMVQLAEDKQVRLAELVEAYNKLPDLEKMAAEGAQVAKAREEIEGGKKALEQGYNKLKQQWEQGQEILAAAEKRAKDYDRFLSSVGGRLAEADRQWQGWDYEARVLEVGDDQAAKEHKQFRTHLAARQAFEAETRQRQQEHAEAVKADLVKRQQALEMELPRIFPHWSDPQRKAADIEAMNATGIEAGFSDQELSWTKDSRVWRLLGWATEGRKAKAQADRIIKGGAGQSAEGGPAKPAPIKVLRAGATAPRGNPLAVQSGRVGAAQKAFNSAPTPSNAVKLYVEQAALRSVNGRR